MKRSVFHHRRLSVFSLLLISLVLLPVLAEQLSAQPARPSQLKFPPLKFQPPQAERLVLDNGIILYLLEDHELPLFDVVVYVKSGTIYDPREKISLAEMTGRVMRTGGTHSKTGDELDEELEYIAGSVETNMSGEAAVANLSVMKKDVDRGLEILAEVLRNPEFRQDKIELDRNRMLENIRRRYDDPGNIAYLQFQQLIYGSDSPWAWLPSKETVNSVTRQDMIAFHQKYFHPNNIIMGCAGDFGREHLLAKLREVFGDWQQAQVEYPEVKPVALKFEPGVFYIEKDINQSNIRMGHLGIRRHNPDEYAVEIMNFIFGASGFTSRIMREVRSNAGLAYSVGGALRAGLDYGTFAAACETKSDTTVRAAEMMKKVIEGMLAEPVREEELRLAKESKLNEFVFNFQSKPQIVSKRVSLEFYGYPLDYLDTYEDKLSAVTKEDVERVAKTYLHPDGLKIIVVGNASKFDRPLSEVGPVQTIELKQ